MDGALTNTETVRSECHSALRELVRLLARQAAREVFAAANPTLPSTHSDTSPHPKET